MDYKIVLDSCGELTYKMKESGIYHTAVLSMLVDGDTILDDESFDRKDFLKRVYQILNYLNCEAHLDKLRTVVSKLK